MATVSESNPLPLVVGAWQVTVVAYGLRETQEVSLLQAALAAAAVLVPVSLLAAV